MTEGVLAHPIIPVVEIESPAAALPLAQALLQGGIHIVEVTLRTPAAVQCIEAIRREVPDILVGAGTVLSVADAEAALAAGAQFGVAPGCNAGVIEAFRARDLPFLPGVMTPTEIEGALAHDCTLLKFFPAAAAGGARYLAAISGPYRHRRIAFCATGGIGPDNAADYLALAEVFAVGGSWLATREMIATESWLAITEACAAAVARFGVPAPAG